MRGIALLDANVLYPAPIRDLLIQLSIDRFFQARWTNRIQEEWIDALMRKEPFRDRAALERTRTLMDKALPDALISGGDELMEALSLPDANDRHVLAAAIIGQCELIVTQNLSDFPASVLARYGIEAQHPDHLMAEYLEQAPVRFCEAVRKVRARLKNPPYSTSEYLGILLRQGLPLTVAALERVEPLL